MKVNTKPALRLRAASLASKFGFGDGDQLDDYLFDDLGLMVEWYNLYSDDECLHKLIEKYLLPELPGVSIYYFETCHNSSRATGDTIHLVEESDVVVDVPFEAVLEVVKQYSTSISEYNFK